MEAETYYSQNRERQLALANEYQRTHKEKAKAYWKKYYQNNKEKLKARHKEYVKNNRAKVNEKYRTVYYKKNYEKSKKPSQAVSPPVETSPVVLEKKVSNFFFVRQEGDFVLSWD